MAPKRKVNLQPKEASKSTGAKRRRDEETGNLDAEGVVECSLEQEVAVDYSNEDHTIAEGAIDSSRERSIDAESTPASLEESDHVRMTKALESWCRNNILLEKGDSDANERVTALAEVGLLLVFEQTKYPDAASMAVELEDIGSIIGGDVVVKKYINFILSLQNQLKKAKLQADRQQRHHHPSHGPRQQHFHSGGHFAFPPHGGLMPMMGHPNGPMFYQQQPMFLGHHPQMMPLQQLAHAGPSGVGGPRGNMTLNTTGEMTAVQKQREKERKRKEILGECTEHLKALLERAGKASDQAEKAMIFDLIDKVKRRIDSLKEIPQAKQMSARAPAPNGQIRGYYGNQYVNPNVAAGNPSTEPSAGSIE